MATYLEMCVTAMRESGLTGSIVSVASQSGIRQVVAQAVAQADYDIQGKFHNWKFLWKEWSKTLTIGANVGLYNQYDPPTDIGEFIYDAAKIDGNAIATVEYERVKVQAASVSTGTPSIMILMPDGQVRLTPIPTVANVLTTEYYRSPLRMTANTDESLIPAKHGRAIETLAIANIHAFNEDWENHKFFFAMHAAEMVKLEADQLLGHYARTAGGTEDNAVRAE